MIDVGAPELVVILALALIVFGPKKLPEVGRTIGKTLREIKKASNDIMTTVRDAGEEDRDDSPLQVVKKDGDM